MDRVFLVWINKQIPPPGKPGGRLTKADVVCTRICPNAHGVSMDAVKEGIRHQAAGIRRANAVSLQKNKIITPPIYGCRNIKV